jgi:PAS domain S-box-containing protein
MAARKTTGKKSVCNASSKKNTTTEKPTAALKSKPVKSVGSTIEKKLASKNSTIKNIDCHAAHEKSSEFCINYSDFFELAPIGYVTTDEGGRIIEANSTAAEQLGTERPALLEKKLSGFILRNYQGEYDLHRQNVVKKKTRNSCDVRMRRKDKSEFFAQLVSTSIKNNAGNSNWLRTAIINITDRVTAEEALKESEELHRITLTNISDAVFITDEAGAFTYICPNVSFIFGYSYDEVLAMSNISKLLGRNLFDHKKLKASKEIQNIELKIKDNAGRTHVLLTNVKSVDIQGGTILYTCHDITERKKAEEGQTSLRLRLEAQWGLAQMVNADHQAICDRVLFELAALTQSKYGFYGFLNEDEKIMRIHSWSKETMKDCDIHRKPIDFPIEKSGVWGNAIRERQTLIINDMNKDYPFKKGLPEGHVGINRLMVVPVFRDNRIVALGAVANKAVDYTEMDADVIDQFMHSAQLILDKRIAEEKIADLSKFPSENPNPVLRIDREMIILYKNEAVSNLLKKNKLSDKNILKILPGNLNKLINDSLNSGNPEYDLEVKIGDRIYSYSISPVVENQYVNLYAIDITDRKNMESEIQKHRERLEDKVEARTKELKDAYKQLQLEVKEKLNYQEEAIRSAQLASIGELAAGVAHEINNPINGIINGAQILLNKMDPDTKEHKMADMVLKEGDRIADIVSSLLSFARESKQEKRTVHILEIMTDTLALTESQIRKERIKLKVNVPATLPDIYAQPQQIEQVFLNIINNARYAMNKKFPSSHKDKVLSISGECVTVDDKLFVRLTFYDTGVGIPYENLAKTMNPFFTTKPPNEGTGLGLSISHGIISDHGGTLKIDSISGEFTKVTIDLPAGKKA